MVAGDLLVSAAVDVPGIEAVEAYLTVPLAQRHLLEPGGSIERVQTIDVGSVSPWVTMLPQRDLVVTVTASLDPVRQADGARASRFGKAFTTTASLRRPRFDYTPAAVAELARRARQGSPQERFAALRTVAGLLAERLAVMREKPDYTPARIDKSGLQAILRAGLSDPDAVVRARMLDNLALFRFSDQQVEMVAPLLSDGDWLVRLAVVDFLAARQGNIFEPVARRLAESDSDPLVRELAELYIQRWQAAAALGTIDDRS
jgi:hypothetical protein